MKKIKYLIDWYNTPTYVPDFIIAAMKLIQNDHEGIFHLVGSDFINRFDWAEKTAKIFNLKKELINPINSSELKLSVERKNIHLNNDKLFIKDRFWKTFLSFSTQFEKEKMQSLISSINFSSHLLVVCQK